MFEHIGLIIYHYRTEFGINRKKFCKISGIPYWALIQAEKGILPVKDEYIDSASEILGVDIFKIFMEQPYEQENNRPKIFSSYKEQVTAILEMSKKGYKNVEIARYYKIDSSYVSQVVSRLKDSPTVIKRMRELKKKSKLPIREFSKKLGVSPCTIHRYLMGSTLPSEKSIKKLEEMLSNTRFNFPHRV